MGRNIVSLGLLRNGKVYSTKQLAVQGLTQMATNDGVAKLARYIDEDNKIRTIVGFYANASEMEDNGGGESSYTIIDIEGSSSDVTELRAEIAAINEKIGEGIDDKTLTDAINEINATFGDGINSGNTVADALRELDNKLTIQLIEEAYGDEDYVKIYTLIQGETEIGKINIPRMQAGDGITVNNMLVNAHAPQMSDEGIYNPIYVDGEGIKLNSTLDMGYYDGM